MTEATAEYLVESSLWSIGGLLLGYALGRLRRDVSAIRKKVEERDDDD
jgi:hypothetical protein